MDTYETIENDQYGIEIVNLIQTVCHVQDDDKQYVMASVETYKQVYLFYKSPYQSNTDYLEDFKANLKLSESHNGALVYHPVL